MLIRWAEMYANTEILSPIDQETWRTIAETAKIDASSRVVELASGKGAFSHYLAKNYGCRLDGFDIDPEFVEYSNRRSEQLALGSKVMFTLGDVRQLRLPSSTYDLGVCLGALYIFREPGWKQLSQSVKAGGCIAVSDLICKKLPPPKGIGVFFEEPGEPLTLKTARDWYGTRGMRIVREVECSQQAWMEYYDLQGEMLTRISKRPDASRELLDEVEKERVEEGLVRKYREEYMSYVTFIMRKL
jgi:sarcosine/dimethylglycine N-methyltransferase